MGSTEEKMNDLDYPQILDMARSMGADEAEVFHETGVYEPVSMEAGELASIQRRDVERIGIRIIREGREGFSSVTDPSMVATAIESAVSAAAVSGRTNRTLPTTESVMNEVSIFDETLAAADRDDLIRIASNTSTRLVQLFPAACWNVKAEKSLVRRTVGSTRGVEASFIRTGFSVAISGTVVREGEIFSIQDYASSSSFDMIGFPTLIEGMVERFECGETIVPVPSGTQLVLLTPNALGTCLRALKPLLTSAGFATTGRNPLKGMTGDRVCSNRVSVWDDGLLEWGMRTAPMDDEGMPCSRKEIIRDGVFMGGIGSFSEPDPVTGRSTGNCFRNPDLRPGPEISTLVMEEGDVSFTDILNSMDSGLVVDALVGNPEAGAGDLALTVMTGYRVEGGAITGRVRDLMLTGSVLGLLNGVREVGRGSRLCHDRFHVPPMLTDGLAIIAAGN